jgi:hypothetical protein
MVDFLRDTTGTTPAEVQKIVAQLDGPVATFATLLVKEGEKQAEEKKAAADKAEPDKKGGIVTTDAACKPA